MVVQRHLDAFKLWMVSVFLEADNHSGREDLLTQKLEVSAESDRASVCMSNPRNCRLVKSYLASV